MSELKPYQKDLLNQILEKSENFKIVLPKNIGKSKSIFRMRDKMVYNNFSLESANLPDFAKIDIIDSDLKLEINGKKIPLKAAYYAIELVDALEDIKSVCSDDKSDFCKIQIIEQLATSALSKAKGQEYEN